MLTRKTKTHIIRALALVFVNTVLAAVWWLCAFLCGEGMRDFAQAGHPLTAFEHGTIAGVFVIYLLGWVTFNLMIYAQSAPLSRQRA